jgi:ribonucleoside-diphosphate reductase alpha chain
MLTSYKYGWKTVYYQNTYDSKTEDEIVDEVVLRNPSLIAREEEDEDCDSGACAI